jgi:hypothetical protein
MLHERKYLFILIGALIVTIGVVLTIYFVQRGRPQNVIENTLEIKLPHDSKIVKYSYDNNGGYFDTKISIGSKNINSVKEQLNEPLW